MQPRPVGGTSKGAAAARRMNRRILIGFVIVLVFVFFFAKPTSVDAQFTVAGGVYTLAPQPPRTNQSGPMTLRDLRNLIHRNGALGSKWWKKPNVSFASSLDPNATLDAALIGRQVAAEAAARFLRDAQNRADNARWVRQETEHVVSAEEDTAVDPEAVYEVLAESTPPTQLVSPCLVANCPRKAYTAFRHYELCRSAVDGLVHWKLNNSAMDLSAAARLKPKVDGPALRTKNEKLTDGTCDGKTQTPNGHITRSGLADCIDPRWPLRLPLTLHRLSSGTTLSCYARGDMVCDIVGRSGGWEAELLSILSGSLATMRASGVRRLSYWREKRYTQLEDVFGRAAVQDAIDRIANSSSRHAELALRPPGANSPFASTAEEMDDILRNDELALRRMPGRTLAAGTFKPKPQDNGEAEPGAMTREERLNFQYGRGDNIYAHELMYDVRRLRPPQVTRGNFGVEYLDIGANVGAFILHLWRSGFPSIAFEALPYNMQLLSTTLCVNGLRHMRGGLGTPSVVQSEPGLDDEPSVTVHYTALGREKDLRCVMMSEDLNFGDTWISCNATHVESTEEFPFQKYRRRGFVNMTRLDSLTTGSTNKLRHESKQRRRAAEIVRHELEAVEAILTASNASAPSLPPMTPLSESFFTKDYIMKIDVEGHEIAVMQGATDFLRSPQRPKMILSEIWKSLNITQYAEVMMSAGYHAVMPFAGIYATTVAGMSNYKSELRLNMDTIIWVLPQWRHRLLPLFSNFEDAAVAHNIGSSERVKW